ncbi:MAG: flavodoxin domain-containing protein [Bacteroidales bacterium]|nr:flavodoxin domain-containing protein [Bacteroidales bacterium]
MKIAIIYSTKHGCADKCAHTLANEIETNTALINLEFSTDANLAEFDTIIIGGSIHAGMINKKVKKFIEKNQEKLLTKKLGLFLCCLFEGEKALQQFQDAYPEDIRNKAIAHGLFGGELDFEKMNFFEKAIVKKVANIEQSTSRINYSNIKDFALKILN